MISVQLPNYLLANRKRLALSQAEVDFLLGNETGETVCRHERFEREPNLQTALAYAALYQRPVRELFAGFYSSIEQEVSDRAKTLTSRMDTLKTTRRSAQKQQAITRLVTKEPDLPQDLS